MRRPFIFELLSYITAGVMHHAQLFQLLKYSGSKAHLNMSKGNVNLSTIALPLL